MAEATPEVDTKKAETDAQPRPGDTAGTDQEAAPAEAANGPAEAASGPAEAAGAPAEDAGGGQEEDAEASADGLTTPLISTDQFTPEISFPGEPVVIQDRFEVFPVKSLPELDQPSAWAFEAEDRLQPASPLFALVCIPEIPARQNVINSIAGDDLPGIIKLIDAATVEWSSLGRWCQILILERPLGGSVVETLNADIKDFQKIDIIREVLQQGMEALQYLQIRGHVHRSIRPDNLFFRDAEKKEIVLGDFMSAPPGFDQPLVFETLERGMANTGGRGRGDITDDYYALGATIAFLLQTGNPVSGMTAEQIIHSKITRSTYQTIVGGNLLTSTLVEPLRGLLEDNADQRWDFESYEMWANGRRVPAVQNPARQRSPRALKFGEFEHIGPRSLAYAMSLRPDTAVKLVKDGTLKTWLGRGIEDTELADATTAAVEAVNKQQEDNRDIDSIILSQVLMVMDPLTPIHYKGASFMTDGYGAALATETIRAGNVKDLAEAVVYQLPTKSFELQAGGLAVSVAEDAHFQALRLHLQSAGPGYGIERCLYLANPNLPCRSPIFGGRYVDHIEDVLPILNEVEKNSDSKQRPFDRHIAAFIGAHNEDDVDYLLDQSNDPDEAVGVLAILKLYAAMQVSMKLPETVALAKWLGGLMGPVIRQYKSRATRRLLEAEVPKLIQIGWLADLLDLINNTDARLRDASDYADAQERFREADEEIERIDANSNPESDAVQRGSKQSAAVLSIIIMCILVTMIILTN